MTKTSLETENCLPESPNVVSRRQFFGRLGAGAAGAAAVAALAVPSKAEAFSPQDGTGSPFYRLRARSAYQLRVDAARENFERFTPGFSRANNGDEELYPNRIANYSKGLPHQPNGEVEPAAYNALLDALRTGLSHKFEQIPLGGDRRLTNPQSGLAFDLEGADPFSMVQAPPPRFASREIAAEIAENYWMALLRDVPFSVYGSNAIAIAAAADLNRFGNDFKGPKADGQVTPTLLFRGLTPGDRVGPYLSQFWYLPCYFGPNQISQQVRSSLTIADGGRNYMTDFESWRLVQNGVTPPVGLPDNTLRYLRNGRDIGEWVHVDMLFQAYYQSFLVIVGLGIPFDQGNPYRTSATQDGFGTFGPPHIATLLCEVGTRALKSVWNQKWFVHRRLRPEVFAERVDRRLYANASYPVHQEILDSLSSASRLGGFMPAGNAFLPMVFPEGSPTHPAYGAGHATVAGACVTILKAWFDESAVIENPVQPDPTGQTLVPYSGETLTVGGELNKVASNVALGRNIAGVHWRSDATESLKLGEAIALGILRDQRSCYNERFAGFNLTKFDGTRVVV